MLGCLVNHSEEERLLLTNEKLIKLLENIGDAKVAATTFREAIDEFNNLSVVDTHERHTVVVPDSISEVQAMIKSCVTWLLNLTRT